MRVYAIHTGSYSDQTWGPVFRTVERALKFKAKAGRGMFPEEISIDVYVLDDENDTGPVYPEWTLVFDRDGNVLFSKQGDKGLYEPELNKPLIKLVPKDCHWWMLDTIVPKSLAHLVIEGVYAPDLEHAIKIGADERARFLANMIRKA